MRHRPWNRLWTTLLLPLAAATAGPAAAQPMNLRTGGWDLVVKDLSGPQPVEIRTRLCLKREDIDSGAVFRHNPDAENCKTTIGARTPTRITYTIVCSGAEASRSTFELVAPTPETMTIRARTEGAGQATVEVTGRFANASCVGYDR